MASKPAFHRAFRERRCLILVDGFQMWQRQDCRKQPFHIRFRDGSPGQGVSDTERIGELKGNPRAHQGKLDEPVTLQELAVSSADEITSLVVILERKGFLSQAEVLAEIQRVKK